MTTYSAPTHAPTIATLTTTLFTTLATITLLTSCTKQSNTPVTINFALQYQGQAFDCSKGNKINTAVTDFRLYLHNFELQDQQNQWHKIELTANPWQHQSTLLLDFVNASAPCKQNLHTKQGQANQKRNLPTNQQLTGLSIENPQAIRFTLGVPFELNHNNPLIAQPPLNESTMHWHWQSGYKFMRAEFKQQGISKRLHIGSLQCKGEVSNISHCEQPNRVTYTIENFNIEENIAISIDSLLNFDAPNKTLNSTTKNVTCMGKTERPWCANALRWLGIEKQAIDSQAYHGAIFNAKIEEPQQ